MEGDEETQTSLERRNIDMMKRFLTGTLNVGSTLSIQRRNQVLQFFLYGKERRRLETYWREHKIHYSRQSVNVKMVLNEEPHEEGGRKMSRDL
jgi:hypothetical protein